ncbi:hypothetical protein DFP72DRAFT_863369 [Ephemerocybe angulata]|uniref:Uncharacterized protein n=1 Tax=Ephemerocybe angulata TaxID=980116 RepID=A0A8H6H7K3_9AGAR|nr:hypothetical protein DFP72DRAFT_863369 [Tulosesus angulatus]
MVSMTKPIEVVRKGVLEGNPGVASKRLGLSNWVFFWECLRTLGKVLSGSGNDEGKRNEHERTEKVARTITFPVSGSLERLVGALDEVIGAKPISTMPKANGGDGVGVALAQDGHPKGWLNDALCRDRIGKMMTIAIIFCGRQNRAAPDVSTANIVPIRSRSAQARRGNIEGAGNIGRAPIKVHHDGGNALESGLIAPTVSHVNNGRRELAFRWVLNGFPLPLPPSSHSEIKMSRNSFYHDKDIYDFGSDDKENHGGSNDSKKRKPLGDLQGICASPHKTESNNLF